MPAEPLAPAVSAGLAATQPQVFVAASTVHDALTLTNSLNRCLQPHPHEPAELRLHACAQTDLPLEQLQPHDAVLLLAPALAASNHAADTAQHLLMRTRQQLVARAQPFQLLYNHGQQQIEDALTALCNWFPHAKALQAHRAALREQGNLARWSWSCDKCSDPECELRLFRGLVDTPSP